MPQFQYGRRFPKRAPSLKLASYIKAIPDHPLSEDYLSNLSGWKILGNDKYGDCLAVAWANSRRFISAMLGKEYYPNQSEVFKIYETQNPGFPAEDNGMDMQTLLEYLNHYGGPDGVKLSAFASVDASNLDEVKAALAIFGSLLLGIEVQGGDLIDFQNNEAWDYYAGQPIKGCHAVLAGGYLSQPWNDVRFITWGEETGMTDSYWNNLVANCRSGEAWVCIWPENLSTKQFIQGIDLPTLKADYEALTGRPFPAVGVTPAPEPTGCLAALLNLFKKT